MQIPNSLDQDSALDLIEDIKQAYRRSGLDSAKLFTLKDYHKNGGRYDGRTMRKLGGFSQIVAAALPEELASSRAYGYHLKKHNMYVSRLQANELRYKDVHDAVLEAMETALAKLPPYITNARYKAPRKPKEGLRRTTVALISDTHFGLDIDPAESMGNVYNWEVSAARLSAFVEQIAQFKVEHRSNCDGLVLMLGGDLGQGVIHWESDMGTQALAHQVVGISSYIIQAVQYLRQHYPRIDIYFTYDNHMRSTYRHRERSTGQKWDSFSVPIATALEARFAEYDDIAVHFSRDPINTFNIYKHKYGLTHGDTHIYTGNVGKTIDVGSLSKQLLALNAVQTDGKYDVFCMGHVHTPLRIALAQCGTEVIVNGTMSGTDAYASSFGFFKTLASQVLWECTEQFAVGDWRIVDLGRPDGTPIIKPYDNSLHLVRNK